MQLYLCLYKKKKCFYGSEDQTEQENVDFN